MATNDKKYWMKRKRYGYGWVPATWQGWLTIVLFTLPVVGDAFSLPNHPSHRQLIQFWAILAVDLAILLFIVSITSPSPHWRWGKKDTDNPNEDF